MPLSPPPALDEALAPLRDVLSGIAVRRGGDSGGHFALAFSGGMDSRFLAYAGHILGFRPHLLMAVGPQLPQEEADFGEGWARRMSLPFRTVAVDALALPMVAANHPRRCYECKREIFGRLLDALQAETGQKNSLPLCDGTNASDLLAHRPGTQAVRELGVRSPLALAGLNKTDIYRLAALTGMERPDQKPRPCLLTRLPYGMRPTKERLLELAAGERSVRLCLAEAGIAEADFRLRLVPQSDGSAAPELHLLRKDAERLTQEMAARLARRIREAAPALPALARLSPQDSLSGFFDRLQDPESF